MMNRWGLRWSSRTLLVLSLSAAFARQAHAQAAPTTAQATPIYQVGDKIECNVTGKWQPGSIVLASSKPTGMFYVVNNDGEAHTWDRWASADQIRRRTGLMSPTEQVRTDKTVHIRATNARRYFYAHHG